jgi:hypothetical protein
MNIAELNNPIFSIELDLNTNKYMGFISYKCQNCNGSWDLKIDVKCLDLGCNNGTVKKLINIDYLENYFDEKTANTIKCSLRPVFK